MVDRAYTDVELDAAIAALSAPDRLQEAQDLVARATPSLQRVLGVALEEGGWFGIGRKTSPIDVELLLQKAESARENLLHITVLLRPTESSSASSDWRDRCASSWP